MKKQLLSITPSFINSCFIFTCFLILFLLISTKLFSQPCSSNVPSVTIDLTGSPDSIWISPNITRLGQCCGVTNPDVCVEFMITLDPGAQGIVFDIYSGAVPGGSMFYQMNCGPPVAVGEVICLDGVGPHKLTFCKPGNNDNQYIISSIADPAVSPDVIVNEGCIGNISTTELEASTVSINSIYPGSYGQYNSYLDCQSGCVSSDVVAQSGYPPYVLYQVCGLPVGGCSSSQFCDTVRITFNPTLGAHIIPQNPTICFGQTSITITAQGSGGTPPYTFQWNTGASTSSISVGVGTYTVLIGDATNCPPTAATVTVTSFISPITANAGTNQTLCAAFPTVTLDGSVVAATGGVWSGGSGTFIPNNTTLNGTYVPSSSELANGHVNLILTTTGNGTCPADIDTVHISFVNFQGTPFITPTSVSCYGLTNGSVSVNMIGGFPPYTYVWNTTPIQTGPIASGLGVGSYTVTITDANGCIMTSSTQVLQPNPLTVITTSFAVSCFGGNNGTATASAFGGTPGYLYQWSNGFSGITATGLSAGTYITTVTDANGCQAMATTIISSPAQLSASISSFINVSCFGGNNGSANVLVQGGTPGYYYSWSSGAGTSANAIGLSSGVYFVTVTDVNSCSTVTSVSISQPTTLLTTYSQVNVSCFGGTNGSATIVASGGSPGYSYVWFPIGGTNATAINLFAGTFTVTVTDSRGCQATGIILIQQPTQTEVALINSNNVSCYGGSNGSACIAVSGGTPGYSYLWQPIGGSSPCASGLPSGNYLVSVTDANNCTSQLPVPISQPAAPITSTFNQINASCFGSNNASIIANPTGGTPPYTFLWNPGGNTTSAINNIPAGNYSVTITDSKYCTYIQTINVSQPTEILLSTSFVQATCSGSNGTATVTPSGGTFPFTYLWSPGGGVTQTIINLPSAAYTVTVTDALSCTQTSVVLVTNAAGPVVTISSVQNVSCFGGNDGQASVTITGGLAPYTYSWAPYGGSNDTATGLGAGVYIVTVTDANGCMGLQYTNPEITQPPAISVTTHQVNVTCTGAANGSASLTVTGGTPGYTYIWSPTGLTTANVSGLSPGTHNVTVTDANGCKEYSFVAITEPVPLSANITTTQNISCYGGSNGSATCIVSGGTLPMSYNWSSGATSQTATGLTSGTHTVYVTDANGCNGSATVFLSQPAPLSISTGHSNVSCYNGSDAMAWVLYVGGTPPISFSWSPSGGTNDTAINLSAGTYFITVTDNNACQQYGSVTISQPVAVNAEIVNFENINCNGGNDGYTTVSVTGGTPGYAYHWSNNSSSPTITGLAIGTYSVTVTDSEGCSDSANVSITEPATSLGLTIASQNVSCNSFSNGAATANVSGGTSPYTYVWVPAGQVTQTAQNLLAGNYTVSVTDINGCQISGNVVIIQPQPLSYVLQIVQPVVCNSTNTGTASVTVQGGTPDTSGTQPYNYIWNTIPVQYTAIADSIYAGPLMVTVTDQMGCTITASSYMPEPTAISAFIVSHSDVSCHDGANGIATAAASGGTPPYTYLWSTVPSQNLQTATQLSPGSYFVTVADANGCQSAINVGIINPTQVITTAMGTGTLCLGSSTIISVTGSGGAGNYFFNWNMGLGVGSSQMVSPLIETAYIVTAYDQNGCPGIPDTVIVSVLSLFPQNVTMYANSPICPGNSSLIYVTAVASSYDTLYYSWSNGLGPGPGAFVVVPLQETTYYVTITNSCNFSVIDSIQIDFKPLPDVHFIPDANQGCVPVTINFEDSSSTLYDEIVYWLWTFGDGTFSTEQNPTHTFTSPDTFEVYLQITTSGGCVNSSITSPYPIYVFAVPQASFSLNATTLYLPNDPAICTNTSTGAVAYLWDFGDGTTTVQVNPTHNYMTLGNYTITLIATNMYNCKDTTSASINATGDIVFPNVFTPDIHFASGGIYNPTDYTNHVFFPYATGISDFHILIFNRWGELIFESNDIEIGWDGYYRGQLCQQDVYVYKAKATFVDGRKVEKAGDIMLLR